MGVRLREIGTPQQLLIMLLPACRAYGARQVYAPSLHLTDGPSHGSQHCQFFLQACRGEADHASFLITKREKEC